MTERFSAPGATLVKLFGRPGGGGRASSASGRERVRDIGVRTAMVSRVFVTALSLVSALAQALVYGLGGYLAVTGQIEPGTVVTLALLLTRLYTPMTALANARVDVMTALVVVRAGLRGARPAADDHRAAGRRGAAGRARSACGCATCASATRRAERVSLASLEEVAVLDPRDGAEVLHGVDLEVGRRPAARARRLVRGGQVDDRRAGARGSTTSTRARSSWPASTCAT